MSFTELPHRLNHRFITLFLSLIVPCSVFAQAQRERTLEEIKTEAIKRAENGMYPLIGLDPADVREAFSAIKTTDNDEWAAAFSAVADRYMAQAKALEATDPAKASATYVRAWRLPKNSKGPVPVVLAISGLDSRKEDLSENFGAILPYGIGFIGVDSPGTGQAPIKASETAERMFSGVLDYLQTRPEVDKTRIRVDGQSFGAYWATKLAILEHARLKAVVAQ